LPATISPVDADIYTLILSTLLPPDISALLASAMILPPAFDYAAVTAYHAK